MCKLLLTLIQLLLLFTFSNLFGQCGSCDRTFSAPGTSGITVENETVCLTGSGTYSGNINLNNNNSVLCISEDVEFTGNLNFNNGTINNYGAVSLTGLNINSGSIFNNYGDFQSTNLNLNDGEFNVFNTSDIVEITGNVIINNGTEINLSSNMIVGGNLNINGSGNLNLDGAGVDVGGTLSANSPNTIVGRGSTSGCEGIKFSNLVLNDSSVFSGGVDICDTDDPSSTPAPTGTSQCNCITLLPVAFIAYYTKANYEHKAVEVIWSTASEENSATFVIQRSANGFDFSPIGSVSAAGDSDEVNNYVFYDSAPVLGKAYYRIKQIDLDGTFDYTNVMAQFYLNGEQDAIMSISVQQQAIQLNFPVYVENGQLEVVNSLGQLVENKSIEVNAYHTSIDLGISGLYILRFSNRDKAWVHKVFIK